MTNFKQISDIIGIHKNIPAIIDCFGPSGKINRSKIDNLHSENKIIRFSCNNWFQHFPNSLKPNYWVLASSVDTIRRYQGPINHYKIPVFYATSLDRSDRNPVNYNNEYFIQYDQKHHDGKPNGTWCCYTGCTDVVRPGKLTIQQELKKYTDYEQQYVSGDSVVFHMIAFAIFMNCNPIYLNGVDLDYSGGYANPDMPVPYDPVWKECADRQISNFEILNKSAKKIGIQILNLNPNSWFDVFEKGKL